MLRHWRVGCLPSVYESVLWPLLSANAFTVVDTAASPSRSISTASFQVTTENYHSRSSILTAGAVRVPLPSDATPSSPNALTLPLEFVQQLIHPVNIPQTHNVGTEHQHTNDIIQQLTNDVFEEQGYGRQVHQSSVQDSQMEPISSQLLLRQPPAGLEEVSALSAEEVCALLSSLAAQGSPHKKEWLSVIEASLTRHHLTQMSFSNIAHCFHSLATLRHPLSWDLVHTVQRLLAADEGAVLSSADLPSATLLLSAILSMHCRSTFLRDLVFYTYVYQLSQRSVQDLPPPSAYLATCASTLRHTSAHHTVPRPRRNSGSRTQAAPATVSRVSVGSAESGAWQWDGMRPSGKVLNATGERVGWAAQCVEAAGRKLLEQEAVRSNPEHVHNRCEEQKDPFLLNKLRQLGGEKLLYLTGLLEGIFIQHSHMKRAPFHYLFRHVATALSPHADSLTCHQLLAVLATCAEVQYKPWELLNAVGHALHPSRVSGKPSPSQLVAAARHVMCLRAHRREASTILLNIAHTASLEAHTFTSRQLASIVSAFSSVRPALRYHAPLFTHAVHRVDAKQLTDKQLVGFVHGLVMSGYVHEAAFATLLAEVRERVGRLNAGGAAMMLEAVLTLQSRGLAEASASRLLRHLPGISAHLPALNGNVLSRCAAAMVRSAWDDSLKSADIKFLDDVAEQLYEKLQEGLIQMQAGTVNRANTEWTQVGRAEEAVAV